MFRDPNDEAPASSNTNGLYNPGHNGHHSHRKPDPSSLDGQKNSMDKNVLKKEPLNGISKQRNSDTYFNHLWQMARDGDSDALNKLSRIIAPDLQRIAHLLLSKERRDHTFNTNALINELYVRLLGNELVTIHNRNHFLALAAKRMRFILIDYARKKNNQKNNNGLKPGTLDENLYDQAIASYKDIDSLLDIDKALSELEKIHSGWAKVVELRYFGGCQFNEIAEIMNINKRRAERYWSRARTWLFNYLKGVD